jgi:hypothetical protein
MYATHPSKFLCHRAWTTLLEGDEAIFRFSKQLQQMPMDELANLILLNLSVFDIPFGNFQVRVEFLFKRYKLECMPLYIQCRPLRKLYISALFHGQSFF